MRQSGSAKATAVRPGAGGKLVSAKSKTGNPLCSAAMSALQLIRFGKSAPMDKAAAQQQLGKCRSESYHRKRAEGFRQAGREAMAKAVENRIGRTDKELKAERAVRKAKGTERVKALASRMDRVARLSVPGGAASQPPAPSGPSLKEQAAAYRASKGTRQQRAEGIVTKYATKLSEQRAEYEKNSGAQISANRRIYDLMKSRSKSLRGVDREAKATGIRERADKKDARAMKALDHASRLEKGIEKARAIAKLGRHTQHRDVYDRYHKKYHGEYPADSRRAQPSRTYELPPRTGMNAFTPESRKMLADREKALTEKRIEQLRELRAQRMEKMAQPETQQRIAEQKARAEQRFWAERGLIKPAQFSEKPSSPRTLRIPKPSPADLATRQTHDDVHMKIGHVQNLLKDAYHTGNNAQKEQLNHAIRAARRAMEDHWKARKQHHGVAPAKITPLEREQRTTLDRAARLLEQQGYIVKWGAPVHRVHGEDEPGATPAPVGKGLRFSGVSGRKRYSGR